MKRIAVCIVAVLAVSLCVFSFSAVAQEDHGALRKLSRGVSNALGGLIWELCDNVEQSFQDEGVTVGATYGVGKGVMEGIGRTLVGVFETLTFFLPFREYEPIIDDPEFPFQIEKLKREGSEYY